MLADALPEIAKPVLLVWGEEDRIIPVAHANALSGRYQVEVLPNRGHMVQMEAANEVNSGHRPLRRLIAPTRAGLRPRAHRRRFHVPPSTGTPASRGADKLARIPVKWTAPAPRPQAALAARLRPGHRGGQRPARAPAQPRCTPSAKKPTAPTSANASPAAPPPS